MMEHNSENIVPLFGHSPKDGGTGGDGMDGIIKRIEQLEKDSHQIRVDMATLKERSENFATKLECQQIKAELATLNASFAQFSSKADTLFASKSDLHKEVSSQTKWLASTLVAIAAVCMTAAKLFF